VEVLKASPARLEHTRALVELGGALRRANQRAAAREPLRAGLDLAHRCGATRLAERARSELAATGAKPRRDLSSGVEALTASERRVADMAATGMSNSQIAQAHPQHGRDAPAPHLPKARHQPARATHRRTPRARHTIKQD